MRATLPLLQATDFPAIARGRLETLQVNLGYKCNQSCVHCHVNAGPHRTEAMDDATVADLLAFLRAGGATTLDLTGGAPELHPRFRDIVTAAPYLKAGKIRPIAVTERVPQVPASVPTFAEAGLDKYNPAAWYGLLAPAGTPREIVLKLAAAVAKAADDPGVKERLTTLGSPPLASTPEQFGDFIRAEIVKWRDVVKASGTKLE